MRRSIYLTAAISGVVCSLLLTTLQPRAIAHCEVPCGIYDDHARVTMMLEDATTIGKATDQIIVLVEKTDALSVNQATRWIMTKEEHATRIQQTIAQYFLTQRVKAKGIGTPEWIDYTMRLADHHAVMVAAMKTKQTTDPAAADALRAAIEKFAQYYPAPANHSHPPAAGG